MNELKMVENEDEDNYALKLVTIQVKAFKTLIESLKDILTEVNLLFDHEGMRITAMNSEKTTLVYLRIDKFEYFQCKNPINVSVDIEELYTRLNMLRKNKTLTIYIKDVDDNGIFIK